MSTPVGPPAPTRTASALGDGACPRDAIPVGRVDGGESTGFTTGSAVQQAPAESGPGPTSRIGARAPRRLAGDGQEPDASTRRGRACPLPPGRAESPARYRAQHPATEIVWAWGSRPRSWSVRSRARGPGTPAARGRAASTRRVEQPGPMRGAGHLLRDVDRMAVGTDSGDQQVTVQPNAIDQVRVPQPSGQHPCRTVGRQLSETTALPAPEHLLTVGSVDPAHRPPPTTRPQVRCNHFQPHPTRDGHQQRGNCSGCRPDVEIRMKSAHPRSPGSAGTGVFPETPSFATATAPWMSERCPMPARTGMADPGRPRCGCHR